MLSRLSLRARLLLGVFVLAAIGLAAADVTTYTSLRSFLLDRVDRTLEAGHAQVERTAFPNQHGQGRGQRRPAAARRTAAARRAQGIDWYQVRTLDGAVVSSGFLVGGGSAAERCPTRFACPQPERAPDAERDVATSRSRRRAARRAIASAPRSSRRQPNRVLVIATSLHDVFGTLHRLLLIELLVTTLACSRRSPRSGSGSSGSGCGRCARSRAPRRRSRPATCRSASSAPSDDRGRPARPVAERDARRRSSRRSRRARRRGGSPLGAEAPALRRRRLARAAHAARRRPRLRRAVQPRRRRPARRPRPLDVGHHAARPSG